MNISKYFSWTEATWLPQWKRLANEKDGLDDTIKANLKKLFDKMDKLREHFNKPIIVHVAYRSPEYNKLVKGASKSSHLLGLACDFHVKDMKCDDVRKEIIDKKLLESLELRMEDNPGSNWVHIDLSKPNPNRYFKV